MIPLYEIDPQGQQRRSSTRAPATQIALLNRALTISAERPIAARSTIGWPWRKPPARLKHTHPLKRAASGSAISAGLPLRLDPLLNLRINEETV